MNQAARLADQKTSAELRDAYERIPADGDPDNQRLASIILTALEIQRSRTR